MTKGEREATRRPAWKAAEGYGIDMSLLEANLRKTPAERIHALCRTLADATALRRAVETSRDRTSREPS
jgi:hypothetical protein